MRTFAAIGPSQSGKTTLVANLAGLGDPGARSVRAAGDATVTTFEFMGEPWAALDIPGGQDSFAAVAPALAMCDAAVLCLPAEVEAAVLSAPYLRLLEESGIPAFLFVNKIDTAHDRVADIIAALQSYSAHGIILRQVPMRDGETVVGTIDLISERAWRYAEGERSALVELPPEMRAREEEARADLLEALADFDDALLEQIIEDQSPQSGDLYRVATRVLQRHELIPALLGSASRGNGIARLMKSLRHEVPAHGWLRDRLGLGEDAIAVAGPGDQVRHVGKAIVVRSLAEGLGAGARLGGATLGGLVGMDGKTPVAALAPGALALAIKSDHLAPGRAYTAEAALDLPDWTRPRAPALRRLIRPVNERDENRLYADLSRIAEIDPGLTVTQDELTGLMEIGLQGPQHLRRTEQRLADGFGLEVECEAVPTALRETIRGSLEKHHRHRKQTGGAGQFADVVIHVAPLPAGEGFAFESTVTGGAVPRNYIPAVEAGARDALAAGPGGHPVVDVKVTLRDGKSHSVDSSDFAFRTAGKNAVREALAEIGTVVLQPILAVQIHVPSVFSGGLVQVISGLKGQVLGFEGHPAAPGWDVFNALLPQAAEGALATALSSATRGTAWFTRSLDHYEEVRTPLAAQA